MPAADGVDPFTARLMAPVPGRRARGWRTQGCVPFTACTHDTCAHTPTPAQPNPPGLKLSLSRLELVGFPIAAPGGGAPPLWPGRLLLTLGSELALTDVRLVVGTQEEFGRVLAFFGGEAGRNTMFWTVGGGVARASALRFGRPARCGMMSGGWSGQGSRRRAQSERARLAHSLDSTPHSKNPRPRNRQQDNSTFIHIHQWSDGRTTLSSVGVLLRVPDGTPNPLNLPAPLVRNCLVAATNVTLLPSLLLHAAVTTQQPLLVYVTTNVSLGAHPPLPAIGVAVRRPVVFVGLQSQITSVDFGMVVNQLNETDSPWSNITLVGLVLENLAPGDAVTSAVAAPFSIAISNNVWAAYYNR
jgi:hypothetical protein